MFHGFPYTNFHDLNLDWLLQECKALSEKVEELAETVAGYQAPAQYWITPQMFGAKGDGVTDDSAAWAEFEASTKGVKYIPKGSYLVNGTVTTYENGRIGNGDSFEVVPHVIRDPDPNETFIYNGRRNLEAVNSGNGSNIGANVRLESEVHYVDDDPEANDNVIIPTELYLSTKVTGYTENTSESSTQNVRSVYVELDATTNGIMGTTCVGGRMHLRQGTEGSTVRGNKGAAGEFITYNHVPYINGGYAQGAEIDLYNFDATAFNYAHANNYSGRITATLVIGTGGVGHTAQGIRIQGAYQKAGCYSPILIGSTCCSIAQADGTYASQGVTGTHGIDMAGFNESYYPEYAIEVGRAKRTIRGYSAHLSFEPTIGMFDAHISEGSPRLLIASSNNASRSGLYFGVKADNDSGVDFPRFTDLPTVVTGMGRCNLIPKGALWCSNSTTRNLVITSIPPTLANGTTVDITDENYNASTLEYIIHFGAPDTSPTVSDSWTFTTQALLPCGRANLGSTAYGFNTLYQKPIAGGAAATYLEAFLTSFNPQFGWSYSSSTSYEIISMMCRALKNLNERVTALNG